MNANVQLQTVFHLTGQPPATPLQAIDKLALRPAMLARYRDLSRLRYDFPLVLVQPSPGGRLARSLTDVVNELVRKTAPPGPPRRNRAPPRAATRTMLTVRFIPDPSRNLRRSPFHPAAPGPTGTECRPRRTGRLRRKSKAVRARGTRPQT